MSLYLVETDETLIFINFLWKLLKENDINLFRNKRACAFKNTMVIKRYDLCDIRVLFGCFQYYHYFIHVGDFRDDWS